MAVKATEELRTAKPVLHGLPGDELYTITDPMDGEALLELLEQRRMAFWNSKPDAEKSHYQGYSGISRDKLLNSLRRQTHAELAAVHAPDVSVQICPWQEIKMDYARQMNEEGRHFRLIRDHLLELGGEWNDEYTPDFPEWNQLFALFMGLDNRFFLDPAREVVARATVLNFGIEGWDHLYVQPLFLKIARQVDETLADIYEEVVMPDETFHFSIGQRVLREHCGDRADLQRVAVEYLDKQLVAHHKVNLSFPAYHKRIGLTEG
jgi:uncharacterized ferritin-like protein (DUF455 family)